MPSDCCPYHASWLLQLAGGWLSHVMDDVYGAHGHLRGVAILRYYHCWACSDRTAACGPLLPLRFWPAASEPAPLELAPLNLL